jgi:hypothetical protein
LFRNFACCERELTTTKFPLDCYFAHSMFPTRNDVKPTSGMTNNSHQRPDKWNLIGRSSRLPGSRSPATRLDAMLPPVDAYRQRGRNRSSPASTDTSTHLARAASHLEVQHRPDAPRYLRMLRRSSRST